MLTEFEKFINEHGLVKITSAEQRSALQVERDALNLKRPSARLLDLLLSKLLNQYDHQTLVKVAKREIDNGCPPDIAVCRALKEANELVLADFNFSSRGHASAVLNGERPLSFEMMKKTSERFNVPLDYFLGKFD